MTVPILIYWVGHKPKDAIIESLAIVGIISLVAAIGYVRHQQVNWSRVFWFGVPGMFGTFLGATGGGYATESLQLSVFGCVLMAAASKMIFDTFRRPRAADFNPRTAPAIKSNGSKVMSTIIYGLLVGLLTGFVGVGGGFMIVPALLLFEKMPIRKAIGTSLLIIFLNSVVGFAKYQNQLLSTSQSVDLSTIGWFAIFGILGSWFGQFANQRIDQKTLQFAFAIFMIVIGLIVLVLETGLFAETTSFALRF